MPELWTDIEIASKKEIPFVKHQLELSLGAPLTIQAHVNQSTFVSITAVLSSPALLRHVRDLEMSCGLYNSIWADQVTLAVQAPAPNLERLCITGVDLHPSWTFPKHLFGGVAPRLRELTLCDVHTIPWDWPPLLQDGLVHLRLRQREPANLPSILQLHSFLTKPPSSLRTLELPSIYRTSQHHHLTPINLHHLELLSLAGAGERVPMILQFLRIAPSTHVEATIHLAASLNVDRQFVDTLNSLSVLRSSTLQPRQLLIIVTPPYPEDTYKDICTDAEFHDYHICAFDSPQPLSLSWDHLQSDSYSIPSPPKLYELNINNARMPRASGFQDFTPFMTPHFFLSGYYLSNLTELYIRSNDRTYGIELDGERGAILPPSWWTVVAGLPSLELLDLAFVDISILVICLLQDNGSIESILQHPPPTNNSPASPNHPPNPITPPRFFPKLKTLILTSVDGFSLTPQSIPHNSTYLDIILRNVELRKRLGAAEAYSRVEFASCYLEDEEWNQISESGLEAVVLSGRKH